MIPLCKNSTFDEQFFINIILKIFSPGIVYSTYLTTAIVFNHYDFWVISSCQKYRLI